MNLNTLKKIHECTLYHFFSYLFMVNPFLNIFEINIKIINCSSCYNIFILLNSLHPI